MEKEKTIFDYLNSIFNKKPLDYNKKIAPAFLLSLWLSHEKKFIDIVNDINMFQFYIKDEYIYKYFMDKIPKGKSFIKWIKKDKDEIGKDDVLSSKESLVIKQIINSF